MPKPWQGKRNSLAQAELCRSRWLSHAEASVPRACRGVRLPLAEPWLVSLPSHTEACNFVKGAVSTVGSPNPACRVTDAFDP
ncbi:MULTISPECIES: hypothetical protein [Anaerolinea]|uniref:hypothetical protein n=1 Tax=Anaerolinea TaxID=233189 RepID=UPI0012DD4195|nr:MULTISPECIES: hypothetical protein [Anaerolinea]